MICLSLSFLTNESLLAAFIFREKSEYEQQQQRCRDLGERQGSTANTLDFSLIASALNQRLGENPRSGKKNEDEPVVEATVVNEPKNEEKQNDDGSITLPLADDDTISTITENTHEKREEGSDTSNEEEEKKDETKDEEKKDESDKPNENDLDDAALLLGLHNPACNFPLSNEPPVDPKKSKFLDAFGGDEKEYERLEAYIKMDDDPTKFADYPKAIDKRRQRGSLKANKESTKYTHEKPKTVDNFLKTLHRFAETNGDYEAAKQYVNTHCRVFATFLDAEMPKKKAKAPSNDKFSYCKDCADGILENHKEKALAKAQKNKAPAAFKLCSTCDEKVKCFAENKKSKKKRGITNVEQTVDLGLKNDDNKNSRKSFSTNLQTIGTRRSKRLKRTRRSTSSEH